MIDFGGFTLALPAGWSDVMEDEGTYSDPMQAPAITFRARGGPGTLLVQVLFVDDEEEEEKQRPDPDDVETLARDWGRRRGLAEPETCEVYERPDANVGTASYKLLRDFVQIWFLWNGRDLLHASYRSPWSAREDEREAREAIITSLRFK